MSKSTGSVLRSLVVVSKSGRSSQNAVLEGIARDSEWVGGAAAALVLLETKRPDLLIVDASVPPAETFDLLDRLSSSGQAVPVVVVADEPCVELAVKFVRAGATDYLPGPLDDKRLAELLSGMETESPRAGSAPDRFFCQACPRDVPMVGKSEGMIKAMEMIRIVSESRCNPVLIMGDTGTGKELAAQAVHQWRSGRSQEFVAVNCAALTASLMESELFGHAKGAFTGADGEKTGLFAVAGEGSIFLDEISEMPANLQAKLLRSPGANIP